MNCKNCKYFFEDSSVGQWECTRENELTDEQLDELCNNGNLPNCPFYEQLPPEPEIPEALIERAPPFSDVLRRIRKEKHFTQERAYKILQVPRRTYEDWERGIASPPEYVQRFIITLLNQDTKIGEKKMFKSTYKNGTLPKEELPYEMRNYIESGESFDLFCAEYGWQDWMNEFTSAAEDEPISEAESEAINKYMRSVWDSLT